MHISYSSIDMIFGILSQWSPEQYSKKKSDRVIPIEKILE